MRKKICSILALLLVAATGARADWTGGTYTATAHEELGAITVNDDATLTINEGVTVFVNDGIGVAEGKTLTIAGPGKLVVKGEKGTDTIGSSGETGGKAGSAVTTNLSSSDNDTYKDSNLNSVITAAGGTGFRSEYHSSTQKGGYFVWTMYFGGGRAGDYGVHDASNVRSVLAF